VTGANTVQPSVVVDEVSRIYPTRDGDYLALDKVSLTVGRGEFVSLLGPSGCGKSTLLQAISGLAPYSSGRIEVNGERVAKPQTDIGIVFQEPFLLEWRSVLRNVMLQAEFRKLDKTVYTERARELLERVGLGAFLNSLPHELSGGMRQRAAICRAMLHDPSLLLMDEPFGALDAMTRDNLNLLLQDIWLRSPKTVIFVTHGITEAILLSDRVVVMSPRPGRIARIIDIDLPRPRTLKLRATPEFGRYAHEVHETFRALGVDA
jgi:NitT/TauT family transport system ATP-binding protein